MGICFFKACGSSRLQLRIQHRPQRRAGRFRRNFWEVCMSSRTKQKARKCCTTFSSRRPIFHFFWKGLKGSMESYVLFITLWPYIHSIQALPDIPDNLSEYDPEWATFFLGQESQFIFNNSKVPEAQRLTDEELRFSKELFSDSFHFKSRYPLVVSLLVSPLFLLLDKKLMNYSWNMDEIIKVNFFDLKIYAIKRFFKVSKALGNSKPPVLAMVECEMWRALLSIVKGQATAFSAMDTFFKGVPWGQLGSLDEKEKEFFASGIAVFVFFFFFVLDVIFTDAVPPTTPISLLMLQTESDVHPDWPLSSRRKPAPSNLHRSPIPYASLLIYFRLSTFFGREYVCHSLFFFC